MEKKIDEKLQRKLIKLFGIENLKKVCRLKELNKKMRNGKGVNDDEYEEHESLLEELETVFPKF